MTSLSCVSGRRESSRNCIECSPLWLVRPIADDARPFHFADRRPVIHDRVMLRAAVVPDRYAVWLPAPAHLIFGDRSAPDQILQQVGPARRIVLAEADVRGRVEVREMGGEAVDEQHLLA